MSGFLQKADNTVYYMLLAYAFTSSISIAGSHVAIGIACLAAIARYCKQPIKPALDSGLIKAVMIFLGVMAISGLQGAHPLVSLNKVWATFYRIVPFFLVMAFVKEKQRLVTLLVTLAVSMLVSDSYAIWQGIHGNLRAGSFSNYMIFAGCLLQMIPLLLVLGFQDTEEQAAKRRFYLLVCSVSMVALVFNGTRGAWLAVVAAILVYAFISLFKDKRVFIVLFLLIILLGALVLNVPLIKDKVYSITDLSNQSNSERLLIWQSAWQMFNDHKLLGIGSGNFKELYNSQYISPMAKEHGLGHAHNNLLNVLAEMGLLGLASFIYLFAYILVKTYREYKKDGNIYMLALLLVTISLIVQGLTEYNFDDSAVIRLYWFITGLVYAAKNLNYRPREII
jgi:Lipid A core - O-antigen ligase and related enzymes